MLLAERDNARPTPVVELPLPVSDARLVFKDESMHASGSLKHRLARALLLQGLRNGAIAQDTPLFDASSGNTAISEAWFARLLGLEFFAVIPETTSPAKQRLIREYGGHCVAVEPGRCCKQEAERRAAEANGYFLDQFGNAATAVDFREHNVIAELFSQMEELQLPQPGWFVTGAGTGGTANCAGRFFCATGCATRLAVVDPEDSVFHDFFSCGDAMVSCRCASRVEGIGRQTVEPSFDVSTIDRMTIVPDAGSYAAARWLHRKLGKAVGISTGCNLVGAVELLDEMPGGMVVSLICDDGSRYAGLLDDVGRLLSQGMDVAPWERALDCWHETGRWKPPQPAQSMSRTAS